MRFVGDGSKTHSPGGKTLVYGFGWFYFVNGNRRPGSFEIKKAAKRTSLFTLFIDRFAILFKYPIVTHARTVLQQVYGGWIEQVHFPFTFPLIYATHGKMVNR